MQLVCELSNQESLLINENNLLSAISVQQWFDDIELQVCALIRSIIQGHPFQDGNKRTAALLLYHICPPDCTDSDVFKILINVAKGDLTDPNEIRNLLFD